jgi:hypothetical protein
MKQYSSEIAKMNFLQNMADTMCMCMCFRSTFQKVVRI